jgi:hypothetical protein
MISTIITKPKCILIHFGFHQILNEFEHFDNGEIGKPPNEWGLIALDSELDQLLF